MELFVGVHHVARDATGLAIVLATQAALQGQWVIAPAAPATHAFVVLRHADGMMWRLDGKPSRAEWTPYAGPWGPQRLWRILTDDAGAMRAAVKARTLTNEKYDWVEIGAQAAVAFTKFLPFSHKMRHLGRVDVFHDAMICTQVARNVLLAVEDYRVVRQMPDLFPERLGQVLREAEGAWTDPVEV